VSRVLGIVGHVHGCLLTPVVLFLTLILGSKALLEMILIAEEGVLLELLESGLVAEGLIEHVLLEHQKDLLLVELCDLRVQLAQ
jgi:hypothetical protein